MALKPLVIIAMYEMSSASLVFLRNLVPAVESLPIGSRLHSPAISRRIWWLRGISPVSTACKDRDGILTVI